jgi:hypothetical protein
MTVDPLSLVVGGAGTLAVDAVREFNKAIFSTIGKRVGEKVSDAIADDVAEFFQEIGALRLRNWADTIRRASELVSAVDGKAHGISTRVLVPLLEHASIEEDEDLRERWAALLAHAAVATDAEAVPPVFAEILSQLTPRAAAVLEVINDTIPLSEEKSYGGAVTWVICTRLADRLAEDIAAVAENLGDARAEYERRTTAAVDILVRQGIATVSVAFEVKEQGIMHGGTVRVPTPQGTEVRITELGKAFLVACSPPTREQAQRRGDSGP